MLCQHYIYTWIIDSYQKDSFTSLVLNEFIKTQHLLIICINIKDFIIILIVFSQFFKKVLRFYFKNKKNKLLRCVSILMSIFKNQ